MGWGRRGRAATWLGRGAAGLAACAVAAGSLAWAQDEDSGGLQAVLDLSLGARIEDSSGGSEEILTSRIGLGLTSATRSQRLNFRVDGTVDSDAGEIRPVARLDYLTQTASTELSFGASYRQERVDGTMLVPDDFFGAELLADDGIRRTTAANLRLVTGKDRRFGTDTRLDYNLRRYTDTADPDLFDVETQSASTALRFDVTRTASLTLTASLSERRLDDLLDREERTERIGLGADVALDDVWRVSANLGFAEIETELDGPGGRVSSTDRGSEVGVTATRTFDDGVFSLSAAHELSASGERTTLTAFRSLTLKSATLSASLGAVRFDSGEVLPLATLSYAQELPRGAAVNVALSQSADSDLEDRDIVRSQLTASYSQPLTASSSWSIDGSLARIDVVGSTDEDSTAAALGLTWRRDLTRDWDLALGAQARRSYQSGTLETRTNVLTAGVERSFTFRP
jgi:hypothetical protein